MPRAHALTQLLLGAILMHCCSCQWMWMQHLQRIFLQSPLRDLTYDTPLYSMKREYDLIVVGAGSAGATLAGRLSEVPGWSVLLLEAGEDENFLSEVPFLAPSLQTSGYSWGYRTEPQPHSCLGYAESRCPWPRGKGMGGTSAINYMLYTRGHPADYDSWQDMGNPGWSWRDVLKYFKKSERAKGSFVKKAYHSKDGYLDVQEIPYRTELSQAFLDSAVETGYRLIDYNSGDLMGVSPFQVNMRRGSRCSSSKAFLRPARHRKNLTIVKGSQVTKVLIDPATRRAYGVEFMRGGKKWSVRAKREVILSAGAINSPHLLMLSGIGPAEHLEEMKISVVQDSPGVGQNLQDHMYFPLLAFHINSSVSLCSTMYMRPYQTLSAYLTRGEGLLTLPAGIEAIGYLRSEVADTPPNYPDVELVFSPMIISADYGVASRRIYNFGEEMYGHLFSKEMGKDAWTVTPVGLQPKSTGSIKLRSKDPLTWPVMDGNYFSDARDVDTIVAGIRAIQTLSQATPFRRYNSTLYHLPFPPCEDLGRDSDPYWRCIVRHFGTTAHHQCGTAKMGPRTDPMAVVDPELRVHGVEGLRVVDASIIPRIPAAHTNAPSIMIAEKAADMIKDTYGA